MINLDETFDEHYMRKRKYLAWRGPAVARAIYDACGLVAFKPAASVVDVGCGVGDIAAGLVELGVDAFGIEGSYSGKQYHVLSEDRYSYFDMREPHYFDMSTDLAICFELMPFIEEEFRETFLRNLARLSDRLLVGRIDSVPGYVEMPLVVERMRAALAPIKDRAAIKAIYNSARYFVRSA